MSTLAGGNIIYNSVKAVLGENIPEFNINWNTKLLRYWGAIGVTMISILKYEILKPYKVVVFDLDNTLYDENEYLFAAYADIGYYVGKELVKSFCI